MQWEKGYRSHWLFSSELRNSKRKSRATQFPPRPLVCSSVMKLSGRSAFWIRHDRRLLLLLWLPALSFIPRAVTKLTSILNARASKDTVETSLLCTASVALLYSYIHSCMYVCTYPYATCKDEAQWTLWVHRGCFKICVAIKKNMIEFCKKLLK